MDGHQISAADFVENFLPLKIKKRRTRRRILVDNPQFVPSAIVMKLPHGVTFSGKINPREKLVKLLPTNGKLN